MARRPPIREGFFDFIAFFREQGRASWGILAASLIFPAAIIALVVGQFNVEPAYKPPEITYVTQWSADRSRQEVMAQQARDLPAERAARARAAAEAERERQSYVRIAKTLGIPLDK